eukprot:GHVH01007650.1.p1 GENE.GHVH01007650.1~~GHVH01007650.1.p1  ORF type:complete len:408 (-),score=33.20 GHVH01007650.1:57-1280(-)
MLLMSTLFWQLDEPRKSITTKPTKSTGFTRRVHRTGWTLVCPGQSQYPVNIGTRLHKLHGTAAKQGSCATALAPAGLQPATMWSVLRYRVSAGLLLVLCASVLTSAEPEGRGSGTQQASLISTLDQLWAFIDRVARTAAQSVLTQVDTRLEDVHSRLSAQLKELSDRLDRHIEAETSATQEIPKLPPRDCSDLPAGSQSGVYLLQPGLGGTVPVAAFCDLDTDGGNWTVIQRRADIQPREDFYLGWAAYKKVFGELDAEFWWGLDNMWAMTSPRDRQYELRIDLGDFEGGKRHAIYQNFRISSESDGYRLRVTNYTGNANDGLAHHIGMRFSTKDRDNDSNGGNCAQKYKGAWWYKSCHDSNLNGQYLAGPHTSGGDGVNWELWRGNKYSLKTASMKIRPTRKSLNK